MSMQSQPLVSVIVPTYNYGNYISDALESVQAQTHTNWECIVVDDGSTDHTAEVIARFTAADRRVRYFRQDNMRQAAARNNGIRQARGEYFQFLDADDLIEPQKLEMQLRVLREMPGVDVVYSDIRYFRNTSEAYPLDSVPDKEPWMPHISGSGQDILIQVVRNNFMPINAALIPRRVIEKVGLFHEGLLIEDWQYNIRCAAAGTSYLFNDRTGVRALVRIHEGSSSSDRRWMLRAEILMRETVQPFVKGTSAEQLNEDRLAEITGLLGVEEFAHGRRTVAARQFLRAVLMDRRPRFRAKWLLCTAAAPFLSGNRMRKFVNSSISGALSGA